MNLQCRREIPSDVTLTQVVLSRSGRMLFAGTNTGAIRSYKFPLTTPGEWQEHQAHSAPITKVWFRFLMKEKNTLRK